MEMGQGICTGLATLVAEELDARRDQIRVVAAPIGRAYGNVLMGGGQGTGGQTSIQAGCMIMRQAGAAMRQMILSVAAARWSTDAGSLTIEQGVVCELNGQRRASFGKLAVDAMAQPVPAEVVLKTRRASSTSASSSPDSTQRTSCAARRSSPKTSSCPAC